MVRRKLKGSIVSILVLVMAMPFQTFAGNEAVLQKTSFVMESEIDQALQNGKTEQAEDVAISETVVEEDIHKMEDLIITEEAEEVVDDDTTEEIGGMSAGVLESEVETVDVEELLENNGWNLVWNDEFEGSELDSTKWSCQIGNGYNGWGNYESQYYTQENVSVSDGTLKITAKKENKDGFNYTSSRIRTVTDQGQTLFSTKYGKVEARIKLPNGSGLWPAFWMMPVDNEYGSWPLSGEIDIMEARGRVLDTVHGTIHFGEERPFNKHMGGSFTFGDGTDITDYHVYAVEWNENTIIWYVDGIEYYRTSNWYTMKDGVVAEYPAPFNQEFYIILNMAVGGNYDSYTLPSDDVLPGTMEVDYVRVYHQNEGYDSGNVEMPEGTRDEVAFANTPVFENGNLLSDTNFETLNETIVYSDEADYGTHNWFFTENRYFPGDASISKTTVDNKVYADIAISNPGTESYAIQLKQLLPLAKGYVYKVSFEAMSLDGERTIKVKPVGGSDRGYANYNDSFAAKLTNELQTYQFSFVMKDETDMNAVLEFNVGKLQGDVRIGNVVVSVVDTYKIETEVEETKEVITHAIENGDFNQGINVWNVVGTYYALEEKDGNVYGKIYTKPKANPWDRMWIQEGIYLTKGKTYTVEFMAKSSADNQKFAVVLENGGYTKTLYSDFVVGKEWQKLSYTFVAKTDEELTLKYFLGMVDTDCKLYLDDVSIKIVE